MTFGSLLLCAACANATPAAGTGGDMLGDVDKMASDGSKMTNNMVDSAWAPIMIQPKSDSGVSGTVTLAPVASGVKFTVVIKGATPGEHGIHVHEKGDCSAADGTSAGGHWNPKKTDHALPPTAVRHAGDLGNITVDEAGAGTLEFVLEGATLKSGEMSLANRGLIIHANVDDGGQPTGNAGGRIACAELKQASAEAPKTEEAKTDAEAAEE